MPASRWHQDIEVAQLIEHLDQPERYGNWDSLTSSEVSTVLKEMDRCRRDFVYAARNYFWISNKKLGDQLFSLWPSQELILQKILEMKAKGKPQKIICIKARQLGCSSLIEGLICWRTVFFSNVNALVVSKDINHAAYALWPIMQFIYDRLPWWLKPMCSMRKAEEGMIFENPRYEERRYNPGLNSRIYVKGAKSGGVGQGIRLSAVHFSEFADVDDWIAKEIIDEDMVNALVESADTFAILESTAKGANRYAHKLWKRCIELEDEAEWYPVFLPWFFEADRVRPLVVDFRADSEDQRMRERVLSEWVRCDNKDCLQYHVRFVRGEDRSETTCITCSTGIVHPYGLTDEQLNWIQHRRRNARRDDESMKKLLQEMCVSGDARVSTPDGIVKLRDASCATAVESGAVSAWYERGTKETVRITTGNGRELICTPEHRIELFGGGWVEASESAGKQIALSPPIFSSRGYVKTTWSFAPCCESSVTIDERFGRFLGYFMGDGCATTTGVQFACTDKDQDVIEDIRRLCTFLMGGDCRVEVRGKMYVIRHNDRRWLAIMSALGAVEQYAGNSHGYKRKVCVPPCIWRSPKPVVKEFLSALFECDGHAYNDAPRTAFFTKHLDFARDIQLLLLGFGVNSRFIAVSKNLNGKIHGGCDMRLNALASNIFHQQIGFISARKRGASTRDKLGKNRSRHEMSDTVVSVDPSGIREVYDLSVPSTHKFGASGISVHNCESGEAAFQVSGYQVFGQKAQEFANSCVRPPIAYGDFDKAGRFHGCNTRAKKVMGSHGEYFPCFQEGCSLDHSYDENPLHVWEFPQPEHEYCVGADVAEGLGGRSDYSAASVTRYNTPLGVPNSQAAVYASNTIDPIAFAGKLNWLGLWYNSALVAVEVNKYDVCLGTLRINLNYPNLYRWKHIDSVNILSNKWGWETNLKSRPRLWQTMRSWLQQELFVPRSSVFAEQMKNFIKEDILDYAAGADGEEHDDVLMSSLISLFCANEGLWNDALGLAVPREELTLENAKFRILCSACSHEWPANTIQERAVNPHDFAPELDVNGQVVSSPGMRCPACGARNVSIRRNAAKSALTDGDMALAALSNGSKEGWSPDMEFAAINFDLPDYSML